MLPSEHITLFVYITQTQTSKASMIAKLCPCHQNVGSPRLVIWATEHLSLLLWLPSGILLQESRSHPSPKSLRLQMEKKNLIQPMEQLLHQGRLGNGVHTAQRCTEPSWPATILLVHLHSLIPVVFVGKWTAAQGAKVGIPHFLMALPPSPHSHHLCPLPPQLEPMFLSQYSRLSHYRDRMRFRNISLSTYFSSCFLDYFSAWEAFHICSPAKAGKFD